MAQGDAMSALMQLSMAGMGSGCIIHSSTVKRGSVFNDFVADRRAMTSCRNFLIGGFAVVDTLEECFQG